MPEELEQNIIREIPCEDSTHRDEKMILFNEIKKLKPKIVVETGTHRGLTTMYMAQALLENGSGELYTADPYEWGQVGNFRKFPEHEKIIHFYQEPGVSLAKYIEPGTVEFMFIDGFHEREEVTAEIDALFPLLKEGAVVYFHDTLGSNKYCDVLGAVDEKQLKVEYLKTPNGMAKYVHISNNPDNKTKRAKNNTRKSKKSDD